METTAHGNLSFRELVTGNRGVTGSEQALLYLAQALGEAGHEVLCYVPTGAVSKTGNVTLRDSQTSWPRFEEADDADIAISWLSASFLRDVGPEKLRINSVQINDWRLSTPDYQNTVDAFVYVSKAHQAHLRTQIGYHYQEEKAEIIPNGVDLARFEGIQEERIPHRCVYLSSPDRGLHWLLNIWPEIHLSYPDAELHVYYEVDKWINMVRSAPTEAGLRALYVEAKRSILANHGVVFHGAMPPSKLAHELLKADLLLYPCDTMGFTEGFGVAVLEAAAAGCLPVITDRDAFQEIYGQSGAVIVPQNGDRRWIKTYLDHVLHIMNRPLERQERRAQVQEFARQYDWKIVAKQWMDMLERRLAMKG